MGIIKKIWSFIISMKLMIVLVAIYAVAIAAATFIENDYGTETAWALVFKTRWFELLQIVLALNLIGNIVKYKIYKPKKLPSLIFHLGFIVVLIGAAMTRYIGYEGVMHIREGMSENRMLSSEAFLQTKAVKGNLQYINEKPIFLSAAGGNGFEQVTDIDGKELTVTFKDYIKNAKKAVVDDPNGKPAISFIVTTPSGPETFFLLDKDSTNIGPFTFYLNKTPDKTKRYVHIYTKNGKFYFTSNRDVNWLTMADQKRGVYKAGKEHEFKDKQLLTIDRVNIVPKDIKIKGTVKIVSKKEADKNVNLKTQSGLSALIVEVEYKDQKRVVPLMGMGQRFKGYESNVKFDDIDVTLEWGSKELYLPFSLYLKDFVMDKYAGSMSPSSYESHVILIDEKNGIKKPYEIYMNHTLTYGGYKFFQSSYDQDEKGTVLSVNHDPGKWPTYIGYIMLAVGFFLNLISPYSRFGKLARTRYGKVNSLLFASLIALASSFSQPLYAQDSNAHDGHNHPAGMHNPTKEQIIDYIKRVDKDYADNFSSVIIQDRGGRMKPIDTVSIDVLNKIYGKSSIFGLDHNQVFVGMTTSAAYWQSIEMIKVSHPGVKSLLGIDENKKYFSFNSVFDKKGQYKLAKAVSEAHRKKPAERGKLDKDLIKVDERINVAYMVYQGDMLRAFPLEGAPNNKWYIPSELVKIFPPKEKAYMQRLLAKNYQGVQKAMQTGDWTVANETINELKEYQSKVGAAVMPSPNRVKMEILYNKMNIFDKLTLVYLLSGLILLTIIFIKLVKPNLNTKTITRVIIVVMILGFIAHTVNLGIRWYIGGHAPWSNGYEAMLYISWTTVLAGLSFARQSDFSVATTAIFAGLTLFTAHLSWLDPQITNIVPVLKSYWLTIHVSVITASYGFLGLSTLLGFITLILFIMIRKNGNPAVNEQIVLNIKEATRINEMSMILGISLLTVGNFLGGVWANESWGRYWGWDPKETWTLVTILVYTIVLHMRFIPKANTPYTFAAASVIAYSSVIMTYFGVNYYLSGMHSYAAGDPVPVPSWIYYVLAVVAAVMFLAYGKSDAIKKVQMKKAKVKAKAK